MPVKTPNVCWLGIFNPTGSDDMPIHISSLYLPTAPSYLPLLLRYHPSGPVSLSMTIIPNLGISDYGTHFQFTQVQYPHFLLLHLLTINPDINSTSYSFLETLFGTLLSLSVSIACPLVPVSQAVPLAPNSFCKTTSRTAIKIMFWKHRFHDATSLLSNSVLTPWSPSWLIIALHSLTLVPTRQGFTASGLWKGILTHLSHMGPSQPTMPHLSLPSVQPFHRDSARILSPLYKHPWVLQTLFGSYYGPLYLTLALGPHVTGTCHTSWVGINFKVIYQLVFLFIPFTETYTEYSKHICWIKWFQWNKLTETYCPPSKS